MSAACPSPHHDEQLDATVVAARRGDHAAWSRLVSRFDRSLRSVARSYRLGPADVDDVVQVAWTRLYENIDRVRDPSAIAAWLKTTTRREAMRVLQAQMREQPSDDPQLGDIATAERPDATVLASEDRVVLGRALATLPGRQRELLTLLVTAPDANYRHISATLDMPVGSIGPIRARGLARLQRDATLRSHYLETA